MGHTKVGEPVWEIEVFVLSYAAVYLLMEYGDSEYCTDILSTDNNQHCAFFRVPMYILSEPSYRIGGWQLDVADTGTWRVI